LAKIINCKVCGDEFDLYSKEKIKSGGLSIHCVDCSEETEVKYAGVQSADGKQGQATVLKFESQKDKEQYVRFWQNNSGLFKGKSCTLGRHLSTTPDIKFKTIVGFNPTNHKGKQ
jgi:hypothetical protein